MNNQKKILELDKSMLIKTILNFLISVVFPIYVAYVFIDFRLYHGYVLALEATVLSKTLLLIYALHSLSKLISNFNKN